MSRGSGLALLGARGRYERNKGIATSNKVQYIYIYISLSLSPQAGPVSSLVRHKGHRSVGAWRSRAVFLMFCTSLGGRTGRMGANSPFLLKVTQSEPAFWCFPHQATHKNTSADGISSDFGHQKWTISIGLVGPGTLLRGNCRASRSGARARTGAYRRRF